MTDARQPDRKIILLSCPEDVPEPRLLCQAMAGALAEKAPESIVRRVPKGEEIPGRAGDIGVALVIVQHSPSGLTGRLDWQVGQRPKHFGPEIRFSVMDTVLSADMYDRFARSLLRANDAILSALAASKTN